MEKEIELSNNIFKQEIDIRSSERLKLMEENRSLRNQLVSKKDNEVDPSPQSMNDSSQLGPKGTISTLDPTISVGGAKAVPLPATTPIIASSLISLMITYSILILFLIAIMWFIVGKKIWNSWKKVILNILLTGTIFYHLQTFLRLGCMIGGRKFEDRN